MKYNALHDAGRFSKLRRNRKRWQKVVSVMASIVVFCTTYALILPAITMEQPDTYCGLENHIHGPECYEKVLTCDHAGDDIVEATPMANVTEGHTHDETCYEEIKNLICEQEEVVGHKHDSSCETLICSLEETSGHSHSDACYEIQYETKTWTEEVTVNDGEELTCTSTEEGHAHDGSCYTAKSHTETVEHTEQVEVGRVLTCTTPESAPHSHDASCYQMVCTQEEVEGHTHTDECYTVEQGELICEIPEVTEAPETTEPEVTDPAEPAHEHSDACYEEKLICGCEIEHEHVADCYIEPPYEPADNEALVCELEEHKHDDACLIAETGELICDLDEHSHDENCYEQLPAFEMWLPLDADIDLDVYTEKHEYIDEDGLYGVTVYAKPDTFDLPVTLEVELLEEDDDRYVNALDVLAAQVEETEEAEEEIVDEAADELAAIDEVTPENTLPEEPAEPTSEAPVAEEEVVEDEVIEEEIIEEEVIEEEVTAQPALTGEEGMIAFDIHFVDEDGDEVQPLEPVYVHIQAMGLLPEDVDLSTVTVQHIREEQPATFWGRMMDMIPFVDETVYIPEVVADMIDEDLGWIDFEPNMDDDEIYDVNTAFEVDGFSTFTITWTYNYWWTERTTTLTATAVDISTGTELAANISDTTLNLDDGNSITFATENTDLDIEGYEFVKASMSYQAYDDSNVAQSYTVDNLATLEAYRSNYTWYYTYTTYNADGTKSDETTFNTDTPPSLTLYYKSTASADIPLNIVCGGEEIYNDVTINVSTEKVAVADHAPDVTGYTYNNATANGSEITHLMYSNGTWYWYKDDTQIGNSTTAPTVNLVYTQNLATTTKEMTYEKYIYSKLGDTGFEDKNYYDLTLNVSGALGQSEEEAKVDVVFILDTSKSMYWGITSNQTGDGSGSGLSVDVGATSRMGQAKQKIINLANSLSANTNVDAQFALVTFNSSANTLKYNSSSWMDAAGIDSVVRNNITMNSGTYYDEGISAATTLLGTSRDSAETIVIFISDGAPSSGGGGGPGSSSSSTSHAGTSEAAATGFANNVDQFYTMVVGNVSDADSACGALITAAKGTNTSLVGQNYGIAAGETALQGIFDQILSQTTNVYATNVEINDTLNLYTKPTSTSTLKIEMIKLDDGTVVKTATSAALSTTTTPTTVSVALPSTEVNVGDKTTGGTMYATYYPVETTEGSVTYPANHVRLYFSDGYIVEPTYEYAVTIEVEPTDKAMDEYKEVGYNAVGDTTASTTDNDTDKPGVDSEEMTSTNCPGFYTNVAVTENDGVVDTYGENLGILTYTYNGTDFEKEYPRPVMQVEYGILQVQKEVYGLEEEAAIEELMSEIQFNLYEVTATGETLVGTLTPAGVVSDEADVKLKNIVTIRPLGDGKVGWNFYFRCIDPGKYRIEEINYNNVTGYTWTEESVDVNGKVSNITEADVVLPKGKTEMAALVNNYVALPKTGMLNLSKTVKYNGETIGEDHDLANEEYTFHVSLPVTGTAGLTLTVDGTEQTLVTTPAENPTHLVVTLKHGETATITGLAEGNYTVAEQNTDGYSVNWFNNQNPIASGTPTVTAAVTAGAVYAVECQNTTGYALPSTGGIGTTLYTMSGMAMMSAALVGGYGLRRKRERGSEE